MAVNSGVILMIFFIIIVSIIIIILLVSIIYFSASSDQNQNGNADLLNTCSQDINISDLIQIPTSGANCNIGNNINNLFYIGNLGDQSLDFVVSPWPNNTQNVCVSYCSSFNNGICLGENFNGRTAQENYDMCIEQLTPDDCIPPLPLAARGTILYYAFSPTSRICNSIT